MKSRVTAGVVVGLLLVGSPSFAAKKNYKADLEGSSVGSPGTGVGNFTFDDVTKRLCGKATYSELTGGPVTAAALKEGDAFTIVKQLTASASPLSIDVTLDDAQVALFETGPIFIAVGNATHGVAAGEELNGEINGELVVDPAGVEQPCGDSSLDGGANSGTSDSGGSNGTGSSNGNGSFDASSGLADPTSPAVEKDDGGCSTTGSPMSSGAILSAAVAVLAVVRGRRRR